MRGILARNSGTVQSLVAVILVYQTRLAITIRLLRSISSGRPFSCPGLPNPLGQRFSPPAFVVVCRPSDSSTRLAWSSLLASPRSYCLLRLTPVYQTRLVKTPHPFRSSVLTRRLASCGLPDSLGQSHSPLSFRPNRTLSIDLGYQILLSTGPPFFLRSGTQCYLISPTGGRSRGSGSASRWFSCGQRRVA